MALACLLLASTLAAAAATTTITTTLQFNVSLSVVSCLVMSCHVLSCLVMSFHVISCYCLVFTITSYQSCLHNSSLSSGQCQSYFVIENVMSCLFKCRIFLNVISYVCLIMSCPLFFSINALNFIHILFFSA